MVSLDKESFLSVVFASLLPWFWLFSGAKPGFRWNLRSPTAGARQLDSIVLANRAATIRERICAFCAGKY
jgi:hypothetical protein